MRAHLVFCGPSTAGKTTLMLGLAKVPGEYDFTVDRTWTSRARRPNEGNEENIFVTPDEFEANLHRFMLPFQTYPTYKYGIERPQPLTSNEIRMRILMPVFALKFRALVPEPTVICAISPFNSEPATIFNERDPNVDVNDQRARMSRFHSDRQAAEQVADLHFQNFSNVDLAVSALEATVLRHLSSRPDTAAT